MVTIAICDDNDVMRNHLASLSEIILKKESVEHKTELFSNENGLLDYILKKGNAVDIIFLDIELGDSNGLKISKKITDAFPMTQIIFVTGHIEYARNICMTHYCNFIVKPINADNLQFVLGDAISLVTKLRSSHITITCDSQIVTINTNEITYCESDKRLIIFHTLFGEKHSYMTMRSVEEMLPDNFIGIHKSFIVNLDYVSEISPYEVRLNDSTLLPIPQKRYKGVKKRYLEYIKSNI